MLGRHASTLFDLDFGIWISRFFFVFWDVMGNPMNGTGKNKIRSCFFGFEDVMN